MINGNLNRVKPLNNELATNFCEYQLDLPQKLMKRKEFEYGECRYL